MAQTAKSRKNNKTKALWIAFGAYTSNRDEVVAGIGVEAAMELDDDDWNETVEHWQPFENMEPDELRSNIENLADEIERAFSS